MLLTRQGRLRHRGGRPEHCTLTLHFLLTVGMFVLGDANTLQSAMMYPLFPLQATRSLLREALKDPLNKRFVLLSETCNPLLPAATVYAQLMAESKSRVNACAMSDKSRNVERCAHLLATALQQQAAVRDECCCDGGVQIHVSWARLLHYLVMVRKLARFVGRLSC